MAKFLYKNGITGVVLRLFLLDTTSTSGAGKTGLTFSSSGLIIAAIADNEATATVYSAAGSTVETITTLGTFAAPTATKCRFKEVDATNLPGVYEIQIADARWAVSNARSAIVGIQVTGAAPRHLEVQLSSFDPNDAVRGGFTALPNAAAEASGGLPTLSAAQASNGTINANVHRWLTGTPNALQSGRVDSYLGAAAAGVIAAATFAANALDAVWSTATRILTAGTNITGVTLSSAYDPAKTAAQAGDAMTLTSGERTTLTASVWNALVSGLTTANSIGKRLVDYVTGDAYGRLGAPAGASVSADVAALQADTDDIQSRLPAALTGAGNLKADAQVVSDKTGYALTSAYDPAKTAAQAGDAMALTSGERTTLAAAIWNRLTSALTTVGSIGKLLVDNIDAAISSRLASAGYTVPPTAGAIADQVWEETLADHSGTGGSTAAALNAAGSAGDPWAAALPGSYGAGTAGKIVGDNLNATVSSRSTYAGGDTPGTTTLLARLTALRAAYLDNLSAGAVALEASLQGLITTVGVAGAGLTAADDAVLAAIAALNNLSQGNVRTALGMGSANLDSQLAAIAGYIDTEVAAIKAKTDNLPSDPADASDIAASFSAIASTLGTIASYIDTEVAAIKAKTDNLPAAPAAVGDIPTTDQVADRLLGRNLNGGADGGRTVKDALRANRNRIAIAAGTMTVYEEDDSTPAWTAAVTTSAGDPVSEVDPS